VCVRGRKFRPAEVAATPQPVEIERKFLIANDAWRQSAVRSVSIRDGLIAGYKDRKVRVRISGDIATVAIKGPRIGIVRPEFEYEIPIADAEGMALDHLSR
jgi:adenylate cyclase